MLHVRVLGTVPYTEAYDLQHALAGRARDDYLLVLEHPHVYTLGVHADPSHVLADPASVGAELARTDRGGDVTYHGPGQLVVYPVVTLPAVPGAGPDHVRRIEQVVIDGLGDLGVAAGRVDEYPGVWIGSGGTTPRKVAAVGVRTVRTADGRRRSLHGVAVNVDPDLSMFGHIVPCGIAELPVTSLAAEGSTVTVEEVAEALIARTAAVWGAGGVDRQDVTRPGLGTGVHRPGSGAGVHRPGSGAGVHSPARGGGVHRPGSGAGVHRPGSGGEGHSPARGGEGHSRGTAVPVTFRGEEERPLLRRLRQAGVDPDAGLPVRTRKPPWLRVEARIGEDYLRLGRTIHDLGLATVCEEAGCPNIFECWADGTATFMVNGSRCTRACGFCLVDTRHPLPLDTGEPERVAEAVERMRLAHAVVTCVARDDLPDGGAGAIAATVDAIRLRRPATTVEVLVSDCKGDATALGAVLEVRPDVFNHNVETVARLQRAVRPSAGYARSLTVLGRAADAGLVVKSGLMVGLGEHEDEVVATLGDLRSVGVSIVTVGQYLRPSADHLPVARWWSPEELEHLAEAGRSLGLVHVEASPLTRSSYHAREAASAAAGAASARR